MARFILQLAFFYAAIFLTIALIHNGDMDRCTENHSLELCITQLR